MAVRAPVTTAPVLSVAGVIKSFGHGPPWHRRRVEVMRGASLVVGAGELVGLVGENGSGKSVLMQIIVGLMAREGGEIALRERLGYCPQQPLQWDKLLALSFGSTLPLVLAAAALLVRRAGIAGNYGSTAGPTAQS